MRTTWCIRRFPFSTSGRDCGPLSHSSTLNKAHALFLMVVGIVKGKQSDLVVVAVAVALNPVNRDFGASACVRSTYSSTIHKSFLFRRLSFMTRPDRSQHSPPPPTMTPLPPPQRITLVITTTHIKHTWSFFLVFRRYPSTVPLVVPFILVVRRFPPTVHAPLQDFHKPFDSPAVLVVGHQTSGKSALIEALMGFQFNQVLYAHFFFCCLASRVAVVTCGGSAGVCWRSFGGASAEGLGLFQFERGAQVVWCMYFR